MNSTKKWIAGAAYILLVAGLFLYLLFPSDAVKSYVRYRLAALAPGTDFAIAGVKPGFPPSLVFSDVNFKYRNQPYISADRLTFLPAYRALFKRRIAFRFNAKMYGGRMDGSTDMAPADNSGQLKTHLAFANIRLDDIPILKNLAKYHITGVAAGHIEYLGPTSGNGTGTAKIRITNCGVKLDPPIFGIPQITFDLADADMALKNRQLNVKALNIKGHDLSGNITGTIFLTDPIGNSRIQLNGKIIPHPALLKNIGALFPRQYLKEGGIPFRIYGTVNQMNYSLQR